MEIGLSADKTFEKCDLEQTKLREKEPKKCRFDFKPLQCTVERFFPCQSSFWTSQCGTLDPIDCHAGIILQPDLGWYTPWDASDQICPLARSICDTCQPECLQ